MSRLNALLLACLFGAGNAFGAAFETMTVMAPQAAGGPAQSVVVAKNHALVRVADGSQALFTAASVAAGASVNALGSGWHAVALPAGMTAPAGLAWLAGLPGVQQTQYDHIYRPNATTDDPLLGSQYGLDQINARQAWDYETGTSARVTIVVTDSGVEDTHVDLSSRVANPTHYAYAVGTGNETVDALPLDVACNHATRVAGIAAARGNNGTMMAGVAWGAGIQIASHRVLPLTCTADCSGACVTDDAAIIGSLNRAAAMTGTAQYGRVVVNMSLGCDVPCACSAALGNATANAVNAGVVLIGAAGNTGAGMTSPGNCSGVIPVGATNASGDIASFSSRGAELASGGVVAPGAGVLSTTPGNTTVTGINGTSFAAPHVAGAAALILAAKPTFTPAQVLATLRNSADPVGFGTLASPYFKTAGNGSGAGRLNAFLAVRLAITGQLADFQGEDKVVAFPNPFRTDRHSTVTFAFPPSLQGATDVTIKIYTLDGTFVRELNSLNWNGKNQHGRAVASGTYLYVVATSKGNKTGRVSVLR